MIQEVLIVRHAHSLHNGGLTKSLDSSLSEEGFDQAQKTADWLKANFDLAGFEGLTSPYLRTVQTASVIHNATGVPFAVHGGLREYHIDKTSEEDLKDGGIKIHNRSSEFNSGITWPKEHWTTDVFFENEDVEEFFTRCHLFINSLKRNGKYVLITHGSPSRTIHHLLTGTDLEPVRARYSSMNDRALQTEKGVDSIKNCNLIWIKDGQEKWFAKTVY